MSHSLPSLAFPFSSLFERACHRMGSIKRLSNAFVSFTFLIFLSRYYFQQDSSQTSTVLVARDSVFDGYDTEAISSNVSHLFRRDDYTCGPGRPCANGACCGGSGYCGYGSTYCGDGCVSNCDAVAECGKDASPSGKECPLNTCCSQYGFCGTTEVGKKKSIICQCSID